MYKKYRMLEKITLTEILYYIETLLSLFNLKEYVFKMPCKEQLPIER